MRKEENVKLLIGDPISRLLDGKLIKSGTRSHFKLVCSISTGFFNAEVLPLISLCIFARQRFAGETRFFKQRVGGIRERVISRFISFIKSRKSPFPLFYNAIK